MVTVYGRGFKIAPILGDPEEEVLKKLARRDTGFVYLARNLPSKPVAPKRFMLAALGVGAGLFLGLLLTAIFEVPLLLTVQSSEDARHYTGLPVLISVPELLTPQEARALPRRRRLLLAAGVVATMVSIPLLALALTTTSKPCPSSPASYASFTASLKRRHGCTYSPRM